MNLLKVFFPSLVLIVLSCRDLCAQKKADSLELILKEQSLADTTRVILLNTLGNIYLQNDSAKAVGALKQAEKLATETGYKKGIALVTKNYGILYEYAGDYKKALSLYGSALILFKELKDEEGISDGYNNLGIIYYLQGIYDKALYYYLEAEKASRGKSGPVFLSNILNNIGLIYDKQKQYDKALTYFLDALKIREQNNLSGKMASSYNNIGLLYQNTGRPDLALPYHLKAKRIREQERDLKNLGGTLNNIADIYLEQKEYSKALETYTEALKIKERAGDRRGKSFSLLGLAETYYETGNYLESIKQAELSLAIAREINLREQLVTIYTLLAKASENLHEPGKAIRYLHEAIACKDSVYREAQQENIAKMAVRFELERAQLEQMQMERDMAAKNKELTRSRDVVKIQFIFVIGISLLLLVAGILIFKLRKTIKQRDTLNQIKDQLFSLISHDYRSPLASVKSSLNLTMHEALTPEEQKTIINTSLVEISNTLNFLDNMLLWANTQLRGIRVNKTVFNLGTVIESNIKLLQPQAAHKNITIQAETATQVDAFADVEMVNAILRNLLSNSIKFSEENSMIKINCSTEANMVTVHITDQGIGIPAEKIPNLFKFDKAGSTYGTKNEKGVGFGLSLCREFIEKNNGTIGVTSQEGSGSDFYFTIPVNK